MRVVVAGGGWSGLAAAVELARHGVPVTLVEAAAVPGGRARTIRHRGISLDNGQHLLIGAYRNVRRLMTLIGTDERTAFDRRRLGLRMHAADGMRLRLRLPALPAPLHLIAGLLTASGPGIADRLRALRFCVALHGLDDEEDVSVAALLARHQQSAYLVSTLWRPLCLAALNTMPEQASARVFARVLRDAFGRRRADSDLWIPRTDLGALVPEPACRFIEAHGGTVRLGRRVTALEVAHGRIIALELAGGERLPLDELVLALPPDGAARLLAPHAPAFAGQLLGLGSAPVCTVYLEYPEPPDLPFPLTGFVDTTAQWVFDLAASVRPGWIAAVISGPGAHEALGRIELGERVAAELARGFPHWPAPVAVHVLRERRATFVCSVGIDTRRPGIATPFPNGRLAGDVVATGWPSTLEGAVASGFACAREILTTAGIEIDGAGAV